MGLYRGIYGDNGKENGHYYLGSSLNANLVKHMPGRIRVPVAVFFRLRKVVYARGQSAVGISRSLHIPMVPKTLNSKP